ncbi:MAG: LptF/LptG family permease [Candidatus Krumholzibacteria bacterium]|nr:LptF/LptG family permease [Candidatus Krumholzibacteria bacterium]MDP7021205.1 LptF/LptG family permease [Candidatus Krumholzibacteria bacterium]
MIRVFDRHIIQQFLRFYLFSILAFVLFFLVTDFSENIARYNDRGTPGLVIAKLYLFQIPWIMIFLSPVCVLLSTFWTFGRMSRDRELSALFSSGISLYRILLPLILVTSLLSAGSYFFNDQVVSRSMHARSELEKADKKQRKPRRAGERIRNLYRRGEDGRIYWAQQYDPSKESFQNLAIMDFEKSRLRQLLIARHAFWTGDEWMLRDARITEVPDSLQESGEGRMLSLQKEVLEGPALLPRDFLEQKSEPDAMQYEELREHIERSNRSGEDASHLEVDLHIKRSYPLANLIILLIGTGLSARHRRITMAAGVGWTVGVGLSYIALLRIGMALGHAGVMSALAAAWIPNLIFLTLGILFLKKASR